MIPEKAEILGLLCSDGNYRKYDANFIEYDKRRHNSYNRKQTKRIIEFANTNIKLLEVFQSLLNTTYSYRPNITISNHDVFRVCVVKNSVVDDILRYTILGTEKWFVPKVILNGNKTVKSAFIRGFFDGDGCIDFVDNRTPRIRITSTNLKGLKQIRGMLENFEIDCKINGPYERTNKRKSYEILLKTDSVEKFIKCIGSNHPKKKERLLRLIK